MHYFQFVTSLNSPTLDLFIHEVCFCWTRKEMDLHAKSGQYEMHFCIMQLYEGSLVSSYNIFQLVISHHSGTEESPASGPNLF